jgi:hypothetical protein
MDIEFEPTRSFCYKFGRYVVLPEIQQLPEVTSGEPFRLTELTQRIIDKYLTPEQQQQKIKKAQSDRWEPVHSITKFIVALQAKHNELFVKVADGVYRAKTEADISDEALEEAALEDADELSNEFEGWIYAFTFPLLFKTDAAFPIKIGKTVGNVEERVINQCKGSAAFEEPRVLGRWQVKRVGPTELAVHNTLKAWGRWRENAPGVEWFDTTIPEIESVIKFVTQK